MKRSFGLPALVALLAAATAFILLSGQSLPPVVASHFAAGGDANGFMPRGAYLGLMLSITVLVPLLLALGHGVVRFVPPQFVSLPNREYWLAPERSADTFACLRRHGMLMSGMLAAFLCFVHWLVVRANTLQPPRLPVAEFVAGLVVFVVVLAVWLGVLIAHFRRRP